jgi:hypothetical protein
MKLIKLLCLCACLVWLAVIAPAATVDAAKTGVVVLNNLGSSLPAVLAWDLTDRLLGLEPEDYLAETQQRLEPAVKPFVFLKLKR